MPTRYTVLADGGRGPQTKKSRWASRTWKRQVIGSYPRPERGTRQAYAPIFSTVRPGLDFIRIELCCFEPPNLWQSVQTNTEKLNAGQSSIFLRWKGRIKKRKSNTLEESWLNVTG